MYTQSTDSNLIQTDRNKPDEVSLSIPSPQCARYCITSFINRDLAERGIRSENKNWLISSWPNLHRSGTLRMLRLVKASITERGCAFIASQPRIEGSESIRTAKQQTHTKSIKSCIRNEAQITVDNELREMKKS